MTRAVEAKVEAGSKVRLTPAYLRAKKRHQDIEYDVTRVIHYVAPNGNGTMHVKYQLHDPSAPADRGYFTCARGALKLVTVK